MEGDYNGDGRQDIYLSALPSSETVTIPYGIDLTVGTVTTIRDVVLIDNGDGTFTVVYDPDPVALQNISWVASTQYTSEYADVDGDGHMDLQIKYTDGSSLQVVMLAYDTSKTMPTVVASQPEAGSGGAGSSPKPVVPGLTPGSFDVSDGAATYAIPIEVPPGASGMTPEVFLGYSSQSGSSVAGRGWFVGGLSGITRCPKIYELDLERSHLSISSNDRFCLNGERLIHTVGEHGADGTQYRTEKESFSRIISHGSQGGGPAYFTVETKAGLKYFFGNTVDSFVEAQGKTAALSWNLNRIEDRFGNYILFHYYEDQNTGQSYPIRIDYTGHNLQAPTRAVEFVYDTSGRNDSSVLYVGGSIVTKQWLLTNIRTYSDFSNNQVVRDYHLNYELSATTTQNRLVSVQECGANSCFPPTTFEWISGVEGFSTRSGSNFTIPSGGISNKRDFMMADINGDGLSDIVRSEQDDSGYGHGEHRLCSRVALEAGGFSTETCKSYGSPELNSFVMAFDSNYSHKAGILRYSPVHGPVSHGVINYIDGDGDVLEDYNEYGGGVLPALTPASVPPEMVQQLNDKYGWPILGRELGYQEIEEYEHSLISFQYGDVDGDGSANVVRYRRLVGVVEVVRGSAVIVSNLPYAISYDDIFFLLADINGDGRSDALIYELSSGVVSVYRGNSSGTFASPINTTINSGGSKDNRIFTLADLNSDGLPDIVKYDTDSGFMYNYLSRGDGTFSSARATVIAASGAANQNWINPADVDGDGLTDIVHYQSTTGVASAYLSLGHGTFSQPISTTIGGVGSTKNNSWFMMAELDGDGLPDMVKYQDGGAFTAHYSSGTPSHKISAITDGLGAKTTIGYKPLTDSTVYTKVNNSGGAHNVIMGAASPIYVVAWHENDNGIGNKYRAERYYENARMNYNGRGFRGFQAIDVVESIDEVEIKRTRTEYVTYANFGGYRSPYNGLILNSEVSLPDGTVIERVDNNYRHVVTFQRVGNFPDVIHPYVSESILTKYELDGALVSTETTTHHGEGYGLGYDVYGNPLRVTVEKSLAGGQGIFKTETINEYSAEDPDNGILGRLTATTVRKTLPDGSFDERRSSFSYYKGDDIPSSEMLANSEVVSPGMLKSTTVEPDSPGTPENRWLTTEYYYDARGNKTRTVVSGADIVTRETTTEYDSNGQYPYIVRNARLHGETHTYDERFGKVATLTGPNGLMTTWVHDDFGRVVREDRADGSYTITSYGSGSDYYCPSYQSPYAIHYVKTKATAAPPVVVYYDRLSREVQRCTVGFGGKSVYQNTEYNSKGEVARSSRLYYAGENIVYTNYTYDALGRPTYESIDGIPGGTTFTYSGNTTSKTNALSQTSSSTVNALGKLISITDAHNNSVFYEYDPSGNVTKVIDAAGNETRMGYDIRGNKAWMVDPDKGRWDYSYNVLGELVWQQDAKLQVVTMEYDVLGRMETRVDGEGTTRWTYDTADFGVGKLRSITRVEDGYSKENFYDSYGRPREVTTTILNVPYTMSTSYYPQTHEAAGKVNTLTYPLGPGGRFEVQNIYDDNGYYLHRVQKSDASVTYWRAKTVDANGKITLEELGNGIETARVFDTSSGLISSITSGAMGNVQSLSYKFDAIGNLAQRADSNQGYTENFIYDDLNRLTSAQLVEIALTTSYRYDEIGNITYKSDVGTYTYPVSGANSFQPHAVTMAGGVNYTYDANGNMISGAGRTIEYTSFGKPDYIEKGGVTSFFRYGPERGRIVQTSDQSGQSSTTIYLKPVGNSNTQYERVTQNNVETHKYYIYGPSGMVALHQERNNATPEETRYFHKDHLGSIDAITNESGEVLERLSYDAFGKPRVIQCNSADPTCVLSSSVTNLGYTGHEHVAAVGVIHMNGRAYDPLLGRFLSADPQVQNMDPQSLNRYTYVNNNPLSHTDPSGYGLWSFISDVFSKIADKIINFVKKYKKVIIAIAASVITAGVMTGWNLAFTSTAHAMAVGAATGFVSGGIMTGSLKGAFEGAIFGGFSAGLAFNIGHGSALTGKNFSRWAAHGVTQGAVSVARGGRFKSGFWGGFLGSAVPVDNVIVGNDFSAKFGRSMAAAVIGGTAAKLGGGKFANGAVSAAFTRLFNEEAKRETRLGRRNARGSRRYANDGEWSWSTVSSIAGIDHGDITKLQRFFMRAATLMGLEVQQGTRYYVHGTEFDMVDEVILVIRDDNDMVIGQSHVLESIPRGEVDFRAAPNAEWLKETDYRVCRFFGASCGQ